MLAISNDVNPNLTPLTKATRSVSELEISSAISVCQGQSLTCPDTKHKNTASARALLLRSMVV